MERTFCPEKQVRWIAESWVKEASLPDLSERVEEETASFPITPSALHFVKLPQVTGSVLEGGGVFVLHPQWFWTPRFG